MKPIDTDALRCDPQCHLCGDEAVIARVIEIDAVNRTAVVSIGNERATVALDLVDADIGDELLIHLGFAIERFPKAEQERV